MKNFADLGGCYPPWPLAFVDNTLLALQNSSYPTQPHSIIAKCYISNWICQKVAAGIVKTSQFCCHHEVQKVTLPSPVLWSHSCPNHPPTAHCGFTLIGDQKQTIIQA